MLLRSAFSADAYPPDVMRDVILADAGQTPLLGAIMAAGMESPVVDQTFKWNTRTTLVRRTQVNNGGAAYDGTTTAIVVDNAGLFQPNSLVLAEATGERLLVTAVNTGSNTLTVVRGVGAANGAPAAAAGSVANDAFLLNLGPAAGEGSGLGPKGYDLGGYATNFCQIFKRAVEMSGTVYRSQGNHDDELATQRQQANQEFLRDIEDAAWFGVPSLGVIGADGRPAPTTGGAFHFVTQVVNVGGNLTRAKVSEIGRLASLNGSGEKIAFFGSDLVADIETLWDSKVQITPSDTLVGVDVQRVQGSGGASQLRIVRCPRWTGPYARQGIIVDIAEVSWRPLAGATRSGEEGGVYANGRIQLGQNRAAKGSDSTAEEWFAHGGFGFGNLKSHVRITGITGIA